MQFALELPTTRVDLPDQFISAEAISEVTRAAVDAGFDAVFVTDHPAPDTKWLDHGGHHALDPFVALAFAAAADPNIRLLTNIYVAAYRNPFLGAKQVQSLDVLSGGRLVLGVAAGYLKPEFGALGVDFDTRGERLDEALAVLDAVCTGDDVAWDGADFRARGVRFRPVAPSGGRPPVWVGGNSRAARRRAARYDGWAPFHTSGYASASRTATIESVEELGLGIADVLVEVGDRPFDICWSEALLSDAGVSVDERCGRVGALASVGVTWTTIMLGGADRAELLDSIGTFGSDVIEVSASS